MRMSNHPRHTHCLMVCTANICRSPMAQAVMQHLVTAHGEDLRFTVHSAAIQGHLAGERPDRRAAQALSRHGYVMGSGRARLITPQDLHRFDLILAMDSHNLAALQAMATPDQRAKLYRLLDFAHDVTEKNIHDPYFGPAQGFDAVLALCEAGCRGLLRQVLNTPLRALAGRQP